MTSSASPASAHGARQTASRPELARPAEPPRKTAEHRTAKDRFAAKLERDRDACQSERNGTCGALTGNQMAGARSLLRDGLQERGTYEGGPQYTLSHNVLAQAPAIASASTSPAGGSGIDPSMLQRMAAQISESWPSAAKPEMAVQFPEGMIATSAHLTREPDGSVAIRIAGLDPLLSARQSARAQTELATALALKQLKVRSLRFERTETDQRALDPTMSDRAISRAV